MTPLEIKRLRAELGDRVVRCMKGENDPAGASIIAGRAYRGIVEARREELRRRYGKKLPWADVVQNRQSTG